MLRARKPEVVTKRLKMFMFGPAGVGDCCFLPASGSSCSWYTLQAEALHLSAKAPAGTARATQTTAATAGRTRLAPAGMPLL